MYVLGRHEGDHFCKENCKSDPKKIIIQGQKKCLQWSSELELVDQNGKISTGNEPWTSL